MDLPKDLYNLGEIYNLCIRRGTLTEEERYKINEHMVFTIVMLEQMHFPKSLKRVPEYAATHHETLDGSGYPRRLTAKDLSVPARIMAIADVFEALTAPDRPYKTPNKVSEAVRILYELKKSRQIDPDIFDLFLTSGLYLRYAEKYLIPEQIDHVDIHPVSWDTSPLHPHAVASQSDSHETGLVGARGRHRSQHAGLRLEPSAGADPARQCV